MFLQIEVIGLKTQVTAWNSMAYVTKKVRLSDWIVPSELQICLSTKKYVSEYVIYAIGAHIWILLAEWVLQ